MLDRNLPNPKKLNIEDTVSRQLQKMTREQVVNYVFTDTVTACRNERYMQMLLANKKEVADLYAVVMLDITAFKTINEKYGHVFGTKVLRQVGDILLHTFRQYDDIIRYYGDVFVLVLYDITTEVLINRLSQAMNKISELEFLQHPELSIQLTAGGCLAETLDREALESADRMLGKAKKNKNRIAVEQVTKSWTKEFIVNKEPY